VSYYTRAKLTGSVRSESLRGSAALSLRTSNGPGGDSGKREPSSFFKVIRMSTKRLYLIILMLVIGCQQAGISADKPAIAADTNEVPAEVKPDEQLEFVKNALLNDPNEGMRIKAATVMLGSQNPLARQILLEVLGLTKNSSARMAVCKALIQARVSKVSVTKIDDFIEPLLSIFSTEIAAEAQLAAEATLIFDYDQIGQSLGSIATDASKPVKTRLNAIQALKLRPDMMATIRLIRLVDDPDKQVAAAAENALHSLGIPVGKDAETREQNIDELQRKGKDVFLREWLMNQEAQMREIRAKLSSWQKRYMTALDKIYNGVSDDAARGKLLEEYLVDSEPAVKLWALDKVYKWQVASGTPKLPPELEPILVNLISDSDKNVRLKTATLPTLPALIVQLNSAQKLLAQLEAETVEQVKSELLVALGGACSYALMPSSSVTITAEVRQQALDWAAKYLLDDDAGKARKGAEVLRKLLEPDGLKPEELDRYLGLLAKRYSQAEKEPNGALRGELLSAMAGLCASGSACKAKAAELFEPLFIEALRDETDFVRETAVDGLIYIDPTSALKRLRNDFVSDRSIVLRKKLIELAGGFGSKEDLTWLVEKIGSNSESGPVWQAMLKIFNGSDSGILNEWMDKLTSQDSKTKLSDEQKIAFLKIAEAKATGETRQAMLKSVREKLAALYNKTGQFELWAVYLDRLYKAARTAKEREAILPELLNAYLRGSKIELAAGLVGEYLSKEDLESGSTIVGSIDNYLSNPPAGADPNTFLKTLRGIKFSGPRPKWQEWLKNWTDRFSKDKGADKPEEAIKPKEG
jgi:HEAT repeat protein